MATLRELTTKVRELLAARDYEQAATLCKKILEVKPTAWPVKVLLSTAYIDGGRPALAREVLVPLLNEKPSDVRVLALLANASLGVGDIAGARAHIEKAEKIDGSSQLVKSVAARIDQMAPRKRNKTPVVPEASPPAFAAPPPFGPHTTESRDVAPSELDNESTRVAEPVGGVVPQDLSAAIPSGDHTMQLDLDDLEGEGLDEHDDELEPVATQAWIPHHPAANQEPSQPFQTEPATSQFGRQSASPRSQGERAGYESVEQRQPPIGQNSGFGQNHQQPIVEPRISEAPRLAPVQEEATRHSPRVDNPNRMDPTPSVPFSIEEHRSPYEERLEAKRPWLIYGVVGGVALAAALLVIYLIIDPVNVDAYEAAAIDAIASGSSAELATKRREVLEALDSEPALGAAKFAIEAYSAYSMGSEPPTVPSSQGSELVTVGVGYLGLLSADYGLAAETKTPAYAEGDYIRGKAFLALGDISSASTAFREALRKRNADKYKVGLAQATAADGDFKTAKRMLTEIGDSAIAKIALAEVLLMSGSVNDAASAASDALALTDIGQQQRARAYLIRARCAASKKDFENAIENRSRFDNRFALELSRTAVRFGLVSKAKELAQSIPKTASLNDERMEVLADIYFSSGENNKLVQLLEGAGESPRIEFLRGKVAQRKGRLDEAREHFKAAIEGKGEEVDATLALADLERLDGDEARSRELLKGLSQKHPSSGKVVTAYVDALIDMNETEEAEDLLRAAEKKVSEPAVLGFSRARLAFAKGEDEKAYRKLKTLRTTSVAGTPEYQLLVGQAARGSRKTKEALGAYEKAVALGGGRSAIVQLGHAYLDLGRAREAEAKIDTLPANLKTPEVEFVRGRLAATLGKGQLAEKKLKLYKEDFEDDPWFWSSYAMARVQAETGGKKEARRALSLMSNNPEAHVVLSVLETRNGSLSRAVSHADAAVAAVDKLKLGPIRNAQALGAKARARFRSGNASSAEQLAKKALKLDKDSAEALFVLAYVAGTRRSQQRKYLKRAMKGNLPMPEAIGVYLPLAPKSKVCPLSETYLKYAPRGFDARLAKKLQRGC